MTEETPIQEETICTNVLPAPLQPVRLAQVRYMNSRYPDDQSYDYYDRVGVAKGDYVLVPVGTDDRLVLGVVHRVFDFDEVRRAHMAKRDIAGIVTDVVQGYFDRLDVRAERAKTLQRLEELEKRQTQIERFSKLAETDPEAAALVKLLKETQGLVVDEVAPETKVPKARLQHLKPPSKRKGNAGLGASAYDEFGLGED